MAAVTICSDFGLPSLASVSWNISLAQRKRASPRGEAGTSGFLCVSDSDRRVPAELGPSARRPGLNVRVAPGPCVLTMVLLLAVSPGVPEISFHNKTEDATSILGGRWGKGVLE